MRTLDQWDSLYDKCVHSSAMFAVERPYCTLTLSVTVNRPLGVQKQGACRKGSQVPQTNG